MLSVGSGIPSDAARRYQVEQIIGAGGMGYVVAARHLTLGHLVAIKLLRDEMASSPTIVDRFINEARAVVKLRTEHVCRVSDVDRLESGAPYIVMEMLEGVDLQRTVARSPLPITTAVEYVLQACVALAEAHAAGIIHRDLKPANLFVVRRPDGGPLVKVLDFGIAKALTEPGAAMTQAAAMGSPGYMSPEQVQSARDVDVRTDIWALGVTLYQLLSARMPFPGPTITEIAISVAHDPPERLDTDPALAAVVMKCLEKSRDRRYASVGELMVALAPFGGPHARRYLQEARAPISTPAPLVAVPLSQPGFATQATQGTQTPPPPPPVVVERRRWPIAVIALVLIGGAVAALVIAQQKQQAAAPVASRDAAVVAVVPPVDAAPVAVVDAAEGDAAQGDAAQGDAAAGDPWKASAELSVLPDEPPPDAAPPPPTHKRHSDDFDVADAMAKANAQMKQACREMFADKTRIDEVAAMAPAGALQCACALGDKPHAQEIYNRMPASLKPQMARLCSMQGLKL